MSNVSVLLLIILQILFKIISVDSRICYVCNTSDKNCADNPISNTTCDSSVSLCYTHRENDQFHRGCADPRDRIWSKCIAKDYSGCFYCANDYCNSQGMSNIIRQLFCVTSKQPSANLKDIVPLRCEGSIPFGSHDYCYYFVSRNKAGEYDVTDRGCYPFKGQVNADSALFYCQSNGCNMYITHSTYMYCRNYDEKGSRLYQTCQTDENNYPAICFLNTTIVNGRMHSGCLTSLESFASVKACSFGSSGNKMLCQTCDRRNCLKYHPASQGYFTKCATLRGMVTCSQYTAQCYIHLSRGKVTQAGCVEPGLSHGLITHMHTLFCSNELAGYPTGCFNLTKDYSKRIGCYKCARCENPEDFILEFKVTCSEDGIRGCYTRMLKDKTVARGCANAMTSFDCNADSSCHICNTSYCNGNKRIRNNLKCYTSKPFGYDHHGSTLQLESCGGRYPVIRDDRCYMARNKRSAAIIAGCIEDAPKDDAVYAKWISGQTSIIFEGISNSCYKCKSDKKGNCFRVEDYLKAHECRGNGQYAIRGCYTFFSQKFRVIARGCLAELDPYLQSLCLMPRFEEFCITCRENACNSHLPSV